MRMKLSSIPRKTLAIYRPREVIDPRFNMQSRQTDDLHQQRKNEGLEKAVAEGNVGVVRDRPDPDGGPPNARSASSDNAIYTDE